MKFYCYVYIVLIIVLFFCFNGGVPAFRDGVHFYHPLFLYLCDEISLRRLPLWNPYENLGQPLAANPTSLCFYPVTMLTIFVTIIGVNRDLAYSLCVVFHILLASVTCYRFIRVNYLSCNAAVFAGLSYALGGAVIFQWNNLPFLIGAAWLPEVLRQAKIIIDNSYSFRGKTTYSYFANDKFSYKKSANIHNNIIVFAISLSMIILGGDLQTAYNIIICVVIIILFSFKYCIRTFVYFLSAGIFVFMFTAIQILPATEFWQLSDRILEQHNTSIDHFSFHPIRISEFFFTGIGGRLFPINTGYFAAFLNEKNVWTPSVYIGLLPAAFAICAVIFSIFTIVTTFNRRKFITLNRHKFILAIFTIMIIFMIASFGSNFLIYSLLRKLPAYNSFRYPSKLLTLVTFAMSFFAALGFDLFRSNIRFAKFTVVTIRIIVTLYVMFTTFIYYNGFMKFADHPLFGPFDSITAKNNLINSVIIVTVIWILLESIYRYIYNNRINKSHFGFKQIISVWGLIIILTIDLFIANSWLMISLPLGHNRMNCNLLDLIDKDNRLNVTEIQSGKNNKLFVQNNNIDQTNNSAAKKQIAPIRVYRVQSLHYSPQFLTSSSTNRFEEIINWEELTLYPRYPLVRRIGVVNVRGTMMHKDYYWAMAQIEAERKMAEKQHATGSFERHLEQLGVTYIIADGDSFDNNFNFNGNKIIIDPKNIECADCKFIDAVSILRLRKPLLQDYVEYEPNRIVFDVEVCRETETIVLAEQYWPGWRAFDGESEIPIKVVRKIFRAVELQKGKHRITMIYDPPLIKIGAIITLAGILLAIITSVSFLLHKNQFNNNEK